MSVTFILLLFQPVVAILPCFIDLTSPYSSTYLHTNSPKLLDVFALELPHLYEFSLPSHTLSQLTSSRNLLIFSFDSHSRKLLTMPLNSTVLKILYKWMSLEATESFNKCLIVKICKIKPGRETRGRKIGSHDEIGMGSNHTSRRQTAVSVFLILE